MNTNRSFHRAALLQAVLLLFVFPALRAQDPTDNAPVSRKEYEELKAEMQALKKELSSLKKEKQAAATQQPPSAPSRQPATPQIPSESPKEVSTQPSVIPELQTLGTTKFLIAGYGEATFEAQNHNISSFEASFNPIFLWELAPKLLFESQIELQLTDTGTDVGLEYAQITYLLNDYITLGAGAMLAPSNVFVERFQALWINKLPDRPLAVYDGFLPETIVGAEIRGGFPIGPARANYAFYVSNGPRLTTDDPGAAGELNFSNFTDNNDNKAVGGRVGFLPIPGVEAGYGFEVAKPGDQGSDFAHLQSLIQSVDLNVTRDCDFLKGRIDLHAQYAWSHVDHAVYDKTGALGFGPLSFSNKRDGGYAQIAYRPTKVDIDFLKNFEGIVRWDHLNNPPKGPDALDEERWTLGLDYWLGPSTAIKVAYEWDQPHGQPNTNAVLVQAVMGF
jgi:hypothetical protein